MASCPSLKCWKLITFLSRNWNKFGFCKTLKHQIKTGTCHTLVICHSFVTVICCFKMTSSLRNSLHRRNHKERSQLAHRAKYGILEKHKDYVLRARDYHSKQDRIHRLKQKAANKNKDEFYFAMKNERTVGGVHVKDRGNIAMPVDMVKLLKSQDEGYIRTIKTVGLKVRSSVHSPWSSHLRAIENRQDQATAHRSGKSCFVRPRSRGLGRR